MGNATLQQIESVKKIFKLRKLWLLLVIFWVPADEIVARLSDSDSIARIFAFSYMVSMMIFFIYISSFKCPRCNKRFFSKWIYYNSFTKKCLHCGLGVNE